MPVPPETQWSLVLAAGSDSPAGRAALARLCQTYHYVVYAAARRMVTSAADAHDLTQGFFLHLLEKNPFGQLDPSQGTFRGFLYTALRHFLLNEHDRAAALKRGGQQTFVDIDVDAVEGRFQSEPDAPADVERLFARRFMLTLQEQALARLRAERRGNEQTRRFERLKPFLTGGTDDDGYRRAAADLDMSEEAIKVAVHRLRQRCVELLREELERTLPPWSTVDDELRTLLATFALP